MAATSPKRRASRWRRALRSLATLRRRVPRAARRQGTLLLGGLLAAGATGAATLPADRADAMYHLYEGDGVTAQGPALLVRKSLADRVSVSASYYLDAVSNASIDVVTTASPFRETRNVYGLGLDYLVRDTLISLSGETSREPDYVANAVGLDVSQEVFGGMTTVSLGFTRASDDVGRDGVGFFDRARHWQYRLGATQILSPSWLMSLNFEAVSDDGYLGNPYRVARVFGAAVPERHPRTRSSRALQLRAVGDIGAGRAVRASYRYFWDTWAIRSHTAEVGFSRYIGEAWLADATLRYNTQSAALFYSDNAQSETLFVSRNRQLSDFASVGLGAKLSYALGRYGERYDLKANGAYELVRFKYDNFTDLRSGGQYGFTAHVLQLFLSATF